MCSRLVVLACIMACAPLALSAQQPDSARQQDSTRQQDTAQQDTVPRPIWQRASSSNWYLRLIVPGPDTVTGRVRYSNGEARMDGDPVPEAILRIERRVVRGNGALVGGVIGLVVGGVVGAGIFEGLSHGSGDAAWDGFGVGAGLGGLFGVLSGQIAAPGREEWEPVWVHRGGNR